MPGFGGFGGGGAKTPGQKVQGSGTLHDKVMGGGGGAGGGKKEKAQASSSKTLADRMNQFAPRALPSSYSHGGKVRRGGLAKVEKGEEVLTAKEAREYRKKTGKRISAAKQGAAYTRFRKGAEAKRAKKRVMTKRAA